MTNPISKTPPVSATSETQCQIPDTLLDHLANDIADQFYNSSSFDPYDKAMWRDLQGTIALALLRVQTETARRRAEIAAEVILKARLGDIDSDLRCVGSNIKSVVIDAYPEARNDKP